MKPTITLATACIALAATGAFADHTATHCGNSTEAQGMRARVATIQSQADRIEWTTDRAEQRRLMDLNMKHMHEGVRELRKREMPVACHLEMMDTMMETMVRHAQLSQDPGSR